MKVPQGPIELPAASSQPSLSNSTEENRVPLRLSVTRGRLGMELYEPMRVGPVTAEQLSVTFLGLRFPLDLSGGVPAFRHRRGTLERSVLATDLERLRLWFEPRFRSAWGEPLVRPLDLWWTESGVGVGMAAESCSIAWEMHWAPVSGAARWVVANVRGWGLRQPAMSEALRILDSSVGQVFVRKGRAFWLHEVGVRLGRYLLPQVGARAPTAPDVKFGSLVVEERIGRVELDATLVPPSLTKETIRVSELAELAQAGDDQMVCGNLDAARNAYLAALELAPRQREIVLLIAEIDLLMGRAESAMGLVTETMPILVAGPIGARLLLEIGEKSAARELLVQAAREEKYSPIAALMLLAKAAAESDIATRKLALDAAVAASPTLECARWARFDARVGAGDLAGALADAQHLEASRIGRVARLEVCRRAAQTLLSQGFEIDAGKVFQRALRYAPNDVSALVGLAASLCATGQELRAIPLLERAIRIADEQGISAGQASVELAKLIATKLGDLPQAVGRLRRVEPGDVWSITARALEGRYRLMMGDVLGASLGFARMREAIELGGAHDDAVEPLMEAARFERDVMRDVAAAERHLAVALRCAPQHRRVQELYREVAAVLAARHSRSHTGE